MGCPYLTALSLAAGHSLIQLEQPAQVRGHKGSSVFLQCLIHIRINYIHWYRQQEGQAPQRLLWMGVSSRNVQWDSVLKADKITGLKNNDGSLCSLLVLNLAKSDEGIYYCAAWDQHSPAY
ncbi:T-cell receptor gamma chain V region PT-gamma-1/2 [Sciurus carolinensis]|nr:T-cell receptor gamma chain V region PT-gamma-1/2 [Sciurus carolinensis]